MVDAAYDEAAEAHFTPPTLDEQLAAIRERAEEEPSSGNCDVDFIIFARTNIPRLLAALEKCRTQRLDLIRALRDEEQALKVDAQMDGLIARTLSGEDKP